MNNLLPIHEEQLHVRNSDIEGRGVFTLVNIKEGELIAIIKGEVIDENECVRREDEENNVYIFWNGDNYIDTAMTPTIKYINHSCDPNCFIDDRNEHSLNLIAAKDIKAGNELTIDYGYEEIYTGCECLQCSPAKKSA